MLRVHLELYMDIVVILAVNPNSDALYLCSNLTT